MQFAGQRTDEKMQPIGEPVNMLVKVSEDVLPHPGALMVTGITPQQTLADGVSEAELARYLYSEVFTPDTVAIGYNNVRFDDEFMRYLFWRNFHDPYEWAWKNNRSRFDLLDVVRMTRALRPEGINWPVDKESKATNRLELITKLNGIEHTAAHDALSDVNALIDVTRLIREKQPKLFDYLFNMRDKNEAKRLVKAGGKKPAEFVYCSGRYSSEFNKCTVALPIGEGKNGSALVFDLRNDPSSPDFDFDMSVKELALNRCPAVAPVAVLEVGDGWKKLGLDRQKVAENKAKLLAMPDLKERVRKSMIRPEFGKNLHAEAQLYDGFLEDFDRVQADVVRNITGAKELAGYTPRFGDHRLAEMFPRYKARNYPKSLSDEEAETWEKWRAERIRVQLPEFVRELRMFSKGAGKDKDKQFVLEELRLWMERLAPSSDYDG